MTAQATRTRWAPTSAESTRVAELLDGFLEDDALIARAQARQARRLAEARAIAHAQIRRGGTGSEFEHPLRSMAAEFAAAARIPDRTIRTRMEQAVDLLDGFPATFAAFEEGRITQAHARAIVDAAERLDDDEARAEYETIILRRAMTMTAGQLRSVARTLADDIEPLPLEQRQAEAMDERRVIVNPLPDGMAEVCATLPAPVAYAIHDRLTRMGRTVREAGTDVRTLDNVRADVLADVLLTGHATAEDIDATGGDALGAIKATVQITIPVETLTGAGDEAAFLTGYGPIAPALARRLAGDASSWARLFVNIGTGALETVDGYTPTAAQRRFLQARDEHCRFPGCRQPAARCDDDHTIAYSEGGPTSVANLSNLCRAHHVLKHNSPWRKHQRADGETEWISPLGRIHRTRPTPVIRFETSAEIARPDDDRSPPF